MKSCLAIFTYQMPTATQGFQDADIQLKTLSNFTDLVTITVKEAYIDEKQVEALLNWQKDPENWKG